MVYTSAGVNRRPECVACSLATGLVYFASHNGLLIYHPSSTRCSLHFNNFTVCWLHITSISSVNDLMLAE